MPRTQSLAEALDKYKSGSGGDFFMLKNDRDSAKVRMLYDDPEGEDLDWYVVHRFKIDNFEKNILCSEEADCPMCQAGNKPQLRLFIQLLDLSDGEKLKVFERPKSYIPKLIGLMSRYGPLVESTYEIERNGAKGDQKTSYEFYRIDHDRAKLEDFPEKIKVASKEVDRFVLVKDYDTMRAIIAGTYSSNGGAQSTRNDSADTTRRARRESSGRDVF